MRTNRLHGDEVGAHSAPMRRAAAWLGGRATSDTVAGAGNVERYLARGSKATTAKTLVRRVTCRSSGDDAV